MDTTVGSIGADRLRIASYLIAGAALVAAIGAGRIELPLALLPLAVLLGWSHLHSV
ncbi:MAG TPA: hypothetical protein VGO86_15095 [Candidatus Dormibacteraeota bacterium]|jgi:hypothetical protein